MAMADAAVVTWIGWGAVVLGTAMGCSSLAQGWRAWRCRRWPKVAGRVLATEIRTFAGVRSANGGGSGKSTYQPIVRYRYAWNGEEHESDTRCYGDFAGSHARAEEVIARYPVGREVQVAVCPSDPRRAVLETDLRLGLLLLPVIATCFVAIGAVMVYRAAG